ncbi:MAG: c-type cytochrome [Flavobacteriaceae bacterium]|nr:c-type cytochrome [Flavobacteriaceae bacterium]
MKKRILVIAAAVPALLYFFSRCNSGATEFNSSISKDSSTISAGEGTFNKNCSGCHNFRQDGIGPQLGGLTTRVSADWIQHFIKNPQEMISSGDERTMELSNKHKIVVPSPSCRDA